MFAQKADQAALRIGGGIGMVVHVSGAGQHCKEHVWSAIHETVSGLRIDLHIKWNAQRRKFVCQTFRIFREPTVLPCIAGNYRANSFQVCRNGAVEWRTDSE